MKAEAVFHDDPSPVGRFLTIRFVLNVLTFLHARLAYALIVFALVLGVWGSVSFFRSRAVSGSFRAAYLLLAGLTGVQCLAGLGVFALGSRPREMLHLVYGIFAIAFLPGIFFYTARGTRAREAAFLAIACWIVLVAYARGVMTGH